MEVTLWKGSKEARKRFSQAVKTLRAALPKADRNVKESPDRLSSWTRTKKERERVWWGEREAGRLAGWPVV